MPLIDTSTTFGVNAEGLFQAHSQAIPGDFMDSLQSERLAKAAIRAGEMDRVASVPTAVVELWMRQGFDTYKEPARAIVARLRKHNLDAFISTPRRV